MKTTHIVLAVLLAALAGCLGAIAADRWANHEAGSGLHDFVHDELTLTTDQEQRLDALEARFAVERARLEGSARAANARLAQAMENEHEYGPEVSAAIDEVHARMGDLQKATVRHVFDMREILEPEQQRQFDRKVSDALTRDPRD
ncbi:periplasmic heavy metal sensor [Qipengyuania citrea]|uniref:Periplasmic heavy metal sensor n=1 Tax=Qipengyuania citrea TaxID=225971 RepID=A0ABY4U5S4_9SPHN|nr:MULTISPECIES: periplasmic heavy metal sensor [Sphingomonadales]MCH2497550.1 periplasmic heavy metal sensor [Erythrobacter sp.]QPL40496.1 periplasmic heavy metal sensor [Erythrobacter sp. A30-3]KPM24312.1 heavy metal resistance protein [Citromicrobium sp. RCC1885]KPM27555.1 heavy metal resistance protein [Citromicrobium sp. RCC1878]OAM10962.1 heavy metal resistance protein [Citromicrobium sp. RCC1897]